MADGFRVIHPHEHLGEMHFLLNAIIAPRPIAWISTVDAEGIKNVAPHSYTTVCSTEPPIIAFVSNGRKDTLNNVEATGEFVYNVVTEAHAEAMNLSSADAPAHVDEFDLIGIEAIPGDVVRAPRVSGAPIAMECKVVDIHKVPGAECWIVMGEVVRFHVAESAFRGERIEPDAWRPVLRTSGSGYTRLGEEFKMKRPSYAELVAETGEQG